jgi:hypothetical protein
MNKASYGETSGFTPVPCDELRTVNGGCPDPSDTLKIICKTISALTRSK